MLGKRAYESARAAECAADQGRFEAMHDKLFEAFAGLDTVSFAPLARQAGVPDIAAFSRCVARTDSLARVSRDLAAALDTLHISGTPTVLVNGKLYPFAPKLAELKKMIQDARDKKARTH